MKYLEIYKKIKGDILSGKHPKDSKLPHTDELIRIFGAARRTVRRAVNMLEMEGLVKGVQSKGTFVRDLKEAHLYMVPKKTLKVGVITPHSYTAAMVTAYFTDIFFGIERTLEKIDGGVHMLACRNRDPLEIIKELNFLEVNSIITVELEDDRFRLPFENLGLPMVHLELSRETGKKSIIAADNVHGGEIALKKLYELDHRNILYLGSYNQFLKKNDPMSDRRWQGISREAAVRNMNNVNCEVIAMERNTRARDVKLALEKHDDCTGIISMAELDTIKETLEKRPQSETKNIDVVFFDLSARPVAIHRKPVWFCKWDGRRMGEMAVKKLQDRDNKFPRIRYMPMFLDRNL
jgi:DNA-binding LacI/PurR family transcriptional regulator